MNWTNHYLNQLPHRRHGAKTEAEELRERGTEMEIIITIGAAFFALGLIALGMGFWQAEEGE